jgi:hypothetical protein
MPRYIQKALTCFRHPTPTKLQDQPYPHVKPNYGAKTQHMMAEDTPPPRQGGEEIYPRGLWDVPIFARGINGNKHN